MKWCAFLRDKREPWGRIANLGEWFSFFLVTVIRREVQLKLTPHATGKRWSHPQEARAHMGSRNELINTRDEATSQL